MPQAHPAVRPAHVPAELEIDWDIHHPPGSDEDIHMSWDKLHEGPDFVWTPRNGGHWIATRGADLEYMMRNPDPFSMQDVTLPPGMKPQRILPLESDPPEHAGFRALITPAFTPKKITVMGEKARALTKELIAGFHANGGCEFITEFAQQLPIDIFLHLAELPLSDRKELLAWTTMVTRPGSPAEATEGHRQMAHYIGGIVAGRRARPGDDVISAIVHGRINGEPLKETDIVSMCLTVLFGGLDTVASTLGFIAHFLAHHPEHRRQLIERPELMANATDEFLRRFGVTYTARTVLRDTEYKGVLFKQGDRIALAPLMAGLDDQLYEHPRKVDFTRKDIIHLTFATGPHRCPGSFLARTEIKVFLEEWLKYIPDFSIKPGDRARMCPGIVQSIDYLPLVWRV